MPHFNLIVLTVLIWLANIRWLTALNFNKVIDGAVDGSIVHNHLVILLCGRIYSALWYSSVDRSIVYDHLGIRLYRDIVNNGIILWPQIQNKL